MAIAAPAWDIQEVIEDATFTEQRDQFRRSLAESGPTKEPSTMNE
jgi:hypothetical protein